MKPVKLIGVFIGISLGSLSLLWAQSPGSASSVSAGTVEHIKVHGKFLEGNLEGDSPDRDVDVYLPSSYTKDRNRRYPVVYFLHGFTDNADGWYGITKHWINLPAVLNKAFAEAGNR